MKLEKEHRASLMQSLEEAQEKIATTERLMDIDRDDRFASWREMDLFLLKNQVELIKASLIANEIDW